ncbi:MAG: hypothetical protein HY736_00890 [Verrucomicrobia bacterium]|nr:hypothetical protein [Verrucomicrobiota bacterium]
MRTLLEIEEAISRLPSEAQRQLVKDIPALCPSAFPATGWDAILQDDTPRPALSSLLDQLDAEYAQAPDSFALVNEDSLREKR